jgi:hypothetical protein
VNGRGDLVKRSAPSTAGARRRDQARRRQAKRRRRLVVLGVAGAAAFALGAAVGAGKEDGPEREAGLKPAAGVEQLPRGGRDLLPRHTLVGFYGAPQDDELGALGIGSPAEAAARLAAQARAYEGRGPVMPVLELLATIAAGDAGEDGSHRLLQPHSVIERYLTEARRQRGLLLLDIQPGRADFAEEVRRLDRWLREPDVGLALDPEWHVGPTEIPGQVIGSVDAETVNEVAARLSRIVVRHDLPEKLLVVHQFTRDMITGRSQLRDRRGVAIVLNSDGFGDPANKIAKYQELRPGRGTPFFPGFKLFYREDLDLMSPEEVLSLRPPPKLIVYE